jgi:glycosyltransferase involved in cell wall biosynthesis
MKLLVIDNGLEHFVSEQVKSIKELDKSIDIIRYSFSARKNKLKYITAIFNINKILEKNKIDLIHAHYGLTGFISLFQNRCPVICTFHGGDIFYFKWQNIISRFTARHCAVNIAVSDHIAKILKINNTYTIPCGFDIGSFYPENKDIVRNKLGLKMNFRYILFTSDPNRPAKNYSLFKKVMDTLNNRYKYNIKELILKGLTKDQVRNYINASDIVLFTSLSEGSNITLKEALSCNTPVVSVDVGDNKDMLSQFSGHLITSYSPGNIVKKVSFVLDNLDYFEHIDFREKMYNYKLDNIARKLLSVYHKFDKYKTYYIS